MKIYPYLEKEIEKRIGLPNIFSIKIYCPSRVHHKNRYLLVALKNFTDEVHYEYRSDAPEPCVELHFEGEFAIRNKEFIRALYHKTCNDSRLRWMSWQGIDRGACRLKKQLHDLDDIVTAIKELDAIFRDQILNIISLDNYKPFPAENINKQEKIGHGSDSENVTLYQKSLVDILACNVVIPDYQRIYCWEESNIHTLWNELCSLKEPYHLGNIILHEYKNGDEIEYRIIDGQQRLVTLSLILLELKYDKQNPLLYHSFRSITAQNNISNAKYVINSIIKKNNIKDILNKIIKFINFSVLVLRTDKLDLAYTFFSNQNSKGVPLTDFDLLKAHHLRYISNELQCEHVARRWNELSLNNEEELIEVLQKHLYRLRKWNRKQNCEEWRSRYVKEEFSAALIMESIPAFGESFNFQEKIQGGAHFFAYAEIFISKYKEFSALKQISLIKTHLRGESHWRYADVIESLLFLYYIKFGRLYISEALYCISSTIAQHRYSTKRALSYKILEFVKDSELVMMIEDASSPTFFIAEALSQIKMTHLDLEDKTKIEYRFYEQLLIIWKALDDISESEIQERI